MSSNGEVRIRDLKSLSQEEKLDLLLEAVRDLTTDIGELKEDYQEILEKLQNIDLPGRDYQIDRFDS